MGVKRNVLSRYDTTAISACSGHQKKKKKEGEEKETGTTSARMVIRKCAVFDGATGRARPTYRPHSISASASLVPSPAPALAPGSFAIAADFAPTSVNTLLFFLFFFFCSGWPGSRKCAGIVLARASINHFHWPGFWVGRPL